MDNAKRLTELKKLSATPELKNGFKSQQDCIAWANKVVASLAYDNDLYVQFTKHQNDINTIGFSATRQQSSLNKMKSILNTSIVKLERVDPFELTKIPYPTTNPTTNIPDKINNVAKPKWYSGALGIIFLVIVSGVLLAITIWSINHYFELGL